MYNFDTTQPWGEDDVAILEAIADQFAQTAENLRLFEETRQQANFEHLTNEITHKLRQAPNLEALVETAATELSRSLGVPYSAVNLEPSKTGQTVSTAGGSQERNGAST